MVKLQPHEAALIQRIYDAITREPWFNRNAVTERELLKLILRNHAANPADQAALMRLCRDEAMGRFSRTR